jgi:cytidylate kinase
MNNLLIKYMEERLKEKGQIPGTRRPGPVVTISREAGCSANTIANLVVEMIPKKSHKENLPHWKVINKEIVHEAAKELDLPPDKIKYVFKAEDRKMLDEMISALSNRYYKSDYIIRKTIMGVIRHIIEDGYVVMVGRGGVAFTRETRNSLNIMLQAPIEWRTNVLCDLYKLEREKARADILHLDKERRLLVDHFYGIKTDLSIYDLVFNCSKFDTEQIAHIIYNAMEMKKMI